MPSHLERTDNKKQGIANKPGIDGVPAECREAIDRIEGSAGQQPKRLCKAAAVVITEANPQKVEGPDHLRAPHPLRAPLSLLHAPTSYLPDCRDFFTSWRFRTGPDTSWRPHWQDPSPALFLSRQSLLTDCLCR